MLVSDCSFFTLSPKSQPTRHCSVYGGGGARDQRVRTVPGTRTRPHSRPSTMQAIGPPAETKPMWSASGTVLDVPACALPASKTRRHPNLHATRGGTFVEESSVDTPHSAATLRPCRPLCGSSTSAVDRWRYWYRPCRFFNVELYQALEFGPPASDTQPSSCRLSPPVAGTTSTWSVQFSAGRASTPHQGGTKTTTGGPWTRLGCDEEPRCGMR